MESAAERSGFGDNPQAILEEALTADRVGDVYTAVKLLRKLIRKFPDWVTPFRALSRIYKRRREWKPVVHYALCVLDRDPDDLISWQDLGIGATALGKIGLAKKAWKQLGCESLQKELQSQPRMIALSIHSPRGTEVVLAEQQDPVQAVIRSIPQPSSGFRYGDLILFDLEETDRVIIGKQQRTVFRQLARLKMAHTQTFSALLHTSDARKLEFLSNLCGQRGLGFDNWSKAERQTGWTTPDGMEYYRELHEETDPIAFSIVALAGRRAQDALEVLRIWKQITLVDYNRLFRLG